MSLEHFITKPDSSTPRFNLHYLLYPAALGVLLVLLNLNFGITVRYQDGGTGTVFGKARFALPKGEETMIRLHKDFRDKYAVAQKLIRTVTEESMNLTARLMTSEEAYAEKRGIFTQWAEQQVAGGKFFTELKSVVEKQEVTNEHLTRNIPVIKYGDDGLPVQHASDFKMYGIKVISASAPPDWHT